MKSPVLSPCDVGQTVTVYFRRKPAHGDPPVEGRLTVVRWSRDTGGELLVSFDLQVTPRRTLRFDLAEGDIAKILIGHDLRVVA